MNRPMRIVVALVALATVGVVAGCQPSDCQHLYPRTNSGPCVPEGAK